MSKRLPAPDAFTTLRDYERRSQAHVAGRPEEVEAPGHWRGVGFRIGEHRLVSGFDEVMEILSVPPIAPVPGAADWMLGVANVRGNLLPVVDLKRFLTGERSHLFEGQRMLVARQSGGNVAVLVDEFYGQRSFTDANRIEEGASGSGQDRLDTLIARRYRLGDATWGAFSLALLTRTPEFRRAAA